ncbi:MAG: YceH family protein [Thermoleophilaceae bacterium]
MEPDAVEIRVVACLVEKQRTTPDQYPLTLNSLRLACNQSTNRDPVVDYDEGTIRSALDRLGRRKWTTLASWSTARSVKYKHVLDQALGLTPGQLSLLAVLMLRGPQTPGELRTRAERMHRFDSNEDLDRTLRELIDRELAAPLPRRPGERGQRYAHLLEGEAAEAPPMDTAPAPTPDRAGPAADGGLGERVDRLEAEVSALRAELHSLREQLGA